MDGEGALTTWSTCIWWRWIFESEVRKSFFPRGERDMAWCESSHFPFGSGETSEPRTRQRIWCPKQIPVKRMSGRFFQMSGVGVSGGFVVLSGVEGVVWSKWCGVSGVEGVVWSAGVDPGYTNT